MSQLDLSISFSHLIGLIICFYIFLNFVTILLVKFWYNQKVRSLDFEELDNQLNKIDSNIFIKRILKL
uniref:ATP synthase F0 subunit 8 n=1 Tax=Hydractinia symbiolongicarpus TaxID=13093 RepID=A0A0S4M228_HYDSY|nr:TPA: ATP synthase F0 subunit 8 [Hydractinia symbiolongicarpus]